MKVITSRNRFNIGIIKKNRFNVGIIIVLMAVPFTNMMGAVLQRPMSLMTDFLMLVAVLLIVDYNHIFHIKVFKNNKNFYMCIVLVICMLAYGIICGYPLTSGSAAVIYVIYTLVLLFAIMTNYQWENEDNFIKILYYISGIMSIWCFWHFSDGFRNFNVSVNVIYSSSGEPICDRLALSNISLFAILSSMEYKSKTRFQNILKCIFIVSALACMLIMRRRGYTGLLIVTVFLRLYYQIMKNRNTRLKKEHIIEIFVIILIVIVVLNNQYIMGKITSLVKSVWVALDTLFVGGTNKVDQSAIIRYSLRKRIITEIPTYSVFNYLFGKGYMYEYLDFPLFQAYIDMGVIVGTIYIIFMFIKPLIRIFVVPRTPLRSFLNCYTLVACANLVYAGIPYGYNVVLVVALGYYYDIMRKNKLRSNTSVGIPDVER